MNFNKIGFFFLIIVLLLPVFILVIKSGWLPENFVFILTAIVIGLVIFTFLSIGLILLLIKDTYSKLIGFWFFGAALVIIFAIIDNYFVSSFLKNRGLSFSSFSLIAWFTPIVFLVLYVLYDYYRIFFIRERILKTGIAGKAKILKKKFKGTEMKGQPYLTLTIEVKISTREKYVLTKDFLVPQMVLHEMEIGSVLDVKVDPKNHKNVFFANWTSEPGKK